MAMFIFDIAITVLAGILGYVVGVAGLHSDGSVEGFLGLVIGWVITRIFQPRR